MFEKEAEGFRARQLCKLTGVHPVANCVRRVRLPCVPPEVCDTIVITIAVLVACYGSFWGRADERLKDEAVNVNRSHHAGPFKQAGDIMTTAAARMEAFPPGCAPSGPH